MAKEGFKILGTKAHNIDRAEDRGKFSGLLDSLEISQPLWQSFSNFAEAKNSRLTSVFRFWLGLLTCFQVAQ